MIPAPELPQIDAAAVDHILANLRASDRRELEATNWSLDGLAERVMNTQDFAFFAAHRDTPAALIGAVPMWPKVWSVFAFGTDDFQKVGLRLTKFARRYIIPAVLNSGAHRMECASIEGHDEAHRWLEALGFHRECSMMCYGRDGETFYRYVMLGGDDVLRRR